MIDLLATLASSVLAAYLSEQFTSVAAQLQKREEASEVLVGFVPEINDEQKEQLTLESGASIGERATILQDAQQQVDALAVDLLGKFQPTKSESNLPGLGSVEYDLSQLHGHVVDSSWLTNMIRLTATPSMIGKLSRAKQVAFVIPNFEIKLPSPVEVTEIRPQQGFLNSQLRIPGERRFGVGCHPVKPALWH